MDKIRTIFFGTPKFALEVLKCLYDEGYDIVAVVSQPDKPVGRSHTVEMTPTHSFASSVGIPTIAPDKLKESIDEVLAYKPDLIITCAYGQIIPEAILEYPKYGCVNVHPSLLPKYRGGAPVHHAILNGDKETGVCLMEMVKKMDAGKVYAKTVVPIGEDMTTEELNIELEKASCELIRNELPKIISGELQGVEQNEDEVVIAKNISKEEEEVSFSSEDIDHLYNHIRALIDWPIAYGVIEGKRMKFYSARKTNTDHDYAIGEVIGFDDGVMNVACIGGILHVFEMQLEGKKKMDASAFKNGIGKTLVGKRFN